MLQGQNSKNRPSNKKIDISVELAKPVSPNTPMGPQTEAACQLRVDESGPGALTNKSSSFNIMPEQALQPRPELAQQPNVNVPKPAIVNANPVPMPKMRLASLDQEETTYFANTLYSPTGLKSPGISIINKGPVATHGVTHGVTYGNNNNNKNNNKNNELPAEEENMQRKINAINDEVIHFFLTNKRSRPLKHSCKTRPGK
jgi:hypothetical protein